MDTDDVWQHVDEQRERIADLLDGLTPEQWETPSLCEGWRVREVAAHLTLAHIGALPALVSLVRARGDFNRMIFQTGLREARRPTGEYADDIRAMRGVRRKPPGATPIEPLADALVHTLDMTVPLRLSVELDREACATAAARCYDMGFPFRAARRLPGVRLRATDADFERGAGAEVTGGVQDLLLLVTGRTEAARPGLEGAGTAALGGTGR